MSSRIECKLARRIAVYLMVVAFCAPAWAEESGRRMHWVTAWGTSQQPNVTAATISNATVRMIPVSPCRAIRSAFASTIRSLGAGDHRPGIGGSSGPRRAPGRRSSQQVFFNSSPSVTIRREAACRAIRIALTVQAWQDIAVSLYIPEANVHPSQHGGAVVTSYVTAAGFGRLDRGRRRGTPFTGTTTSVYWLKSIDVLSTRSTSAVVAFGIRSPTAPARRWTLTIAGGLGLGPARSGLPGRIVRDGAADRS